MIKDTIAKEYQFLLLELFQTKIFKADSVSMRNSEGQMEEFISKAELMEKSIEMLNELGENMSNDERLTK